MTLSSNPDPSSPPTEIASQAELVGLVGQITRGQRDALKPLYDATVDLSYEVALRIVGEPALADDAVANAYMQVWTHASRYDPERATVRGWIAMLTRARALDVARSGRRHRALADRAEACVSDPDVVPQAARISEECQIVQRALAALPDNERIALECAFFDGLTHVEIAEQLGAPLGTIKARIRKALQRLRTRLQSLQADALQSRPDPVNHGGAE